MSFVAAAIGGAATIGAAALGGKGGGSSTSVKEPKWLTDKKRGAVDRAETLSNRAYEGYQGDRVASLSGNERSALDMAARGSAQSREMLGRGAEELDEASALEFGDSVSDYMNPYIESVLQPQLREQNRQYERSRTHLQNSRMGAWGGDRAAFEEAELERTHREGIADITGKTYSEAFDRATQNFFSDQTRKQNAAAAYERLGRGMQALDTGDIQNLMATGGVERLLRQANLDANFSAFLEERDWDVNNLDILLNSLSVAGGNSTTTRKDGGNGAIGQILGAGAALAGAYFTGRQEPLEEFDTSSIEAYRIGPKE